MNASFYVKYVTSICFWCHSPACSAVFQSSKWQVYAPSTQNLQANKHYYRGRIWKTEWNTTHILHKPCTNLAHSLLKSCCSFPTQIIKKQNPKLQHTPTRQSNTLSRSFQLSLENSTLQLSSAKFGSTNAVQGWQMNCSLIPSWIYDNGH